ncbi:MAG: starch-binding protein, partial [Ruminococcus sp.]
SLAGLPDFKTESTTSVTIPPILKTKWIKEGTLNEKVSRYGSSDTVSGYLVKWLSEWVSQYGVDGFRCDTAKHVEKESWKKLKDSCVKALNTWRSNNPGKAGADWDEDFWMTGEHWDHKVGYDDYYSQGGFDSMINFDSSGSCLPDASSINGKYQYYASAINSRDDFNVLTYISSHDSNLARSSDMIYQGSALLLLPGGVQIFYGDETNRKTVSGMSFDGQGGSGHSLRSDMNWDSIDTEELAHWQKVGQFRNNHVAVGAGDHQQITAYNSSTGYTFSRCYDDGTVADNIIATIGAPKNTEIAVNVSSIWSDGITVTNFYDGTTATVEDGKAVFNSGANGTILIEGPISTINMSLKGSYSFYDSQELTVSLRGADYAMVSVNGGTPFRVVNGDTFTVGEGIELGAEFKVTITASNDEETSKKSYTYKKKDPAAVTRIYFDNSQYKWSTVNAYIYDESGSETLENSAWPGEAMEYDSGTGYYVIEVPDGLENGRVMFNAGMGSSDRYPGDGAEGLAINETNMIFSYGNTWQPYNGQTIPTTTQKPYDPADYTTVFFDNSSSNFSTPYIYYWRASTDSGDEKWPGVAMTKYDGDIWTATFPKDNDMCVFSNNGGNQTGNLNIPGSNQIYRNGNWEAFDVPTTTTSSTSPTTTSTSPIVVGSLGDANGDSAIDIRDVTTVQKHCSGMTVAIILDNADVNKDGEINVRDATLIQRFVSKDITQF